MGGIFGIIRKDGGPVDESDLSLMREKLAHRSVDGSGVKTFPGAGLGYLHFSLFPEYEKEIGPYEYGHWTITADARLDARRELMRALGIQNDDGGHLNDSYLIVRAYEKWGHNCLDHLIGDFAFAIWDKRTKELFCARDFAGIKPFFYHNSIDKFFFSSEIQALLALSGIPNKLNEDKIKDHLLMMWFGGDHVAETFFSGLMRLMPGRYLVVNKKGIKVETYWRRPANKLFYRKNEDYAEAFREIVVTAVHDRIRTTEPIGATLSGGLDSSSISCIAAKELAQSNRVLCTASSVMPENHDGIEEDERAYIMEVLKQESNIHANFLTAQNKSPFEELETVFNYTCDPVNTFYYMDRLIFSTLGEKNGVKLILSGLGGDQAASYYGRNIFTTCLRELRLSQLVKVLLEFNKVTRRSLKKTLKKDIIIPAVPKNLLRKYLKFRKASIPDIYDISAIHSQFDKNGDFQRYYNNFYDGLYATWNVRRSIWNPELLPFSENESVLSSRSQTMLTYPLLDKRVINFLLKIPPEKLLLGGWPRGLIRFAMEGILPSAVQWRGDKTMYSPDYNRRLIRESTELKNRLDKIKQQTPFVSKYIDFEILKESLDDVRIIKDMKSYDDRTITLTGMGILLAFFLHFFKKKL